MSRLSDTVSADMYAYLEERGHATLDEFAMMPNRHLARKPTHHARKQTIWRTARDRPELYSIEHMTTTKGRFTIIVKRRGRQ